MNNYSPNALKTFETCPYKYKFMYMDNISVPQKISYFEKGKKIHALANYYLRGDSIEKLENTLNTEEHNIWESLKNNEFFQKSHVASEYNLSCKLGDFWVGGRIDAIVKDEESYYILDYKTGSIPPNPEYDFQTMIYLLCLYKKICHSGQNEGLNKNISFVYIDLKNNKNHIIEFSKDKLAEYEQKIIKICNEIKNVQFQEEIEHSKKCDFCEYNKICF